MTTPRVAIVGAGFSGIGAAIALQRQGIDTFTIFEKAADVGGVWRDNTYPGAACDVPSYLYSFSYRQRRDWTRPCSPQQEILDYLHDVVREERLESHLALGVGVVEASYDDSSCQWRVTLASGESDVFDVVVTACGQLSRPKLPVIEGMEQFAGPSFHSAEWDHGVDLTGKRVAVVGTGASAIQFVPTLVEQAAHVDLYQRSAPWLLPRTNEEYSGRVKTFLHHFPVVQRLRRRALYRLMDWAAVGLTESPRRLAAYRIAARVMRRWQVRDRSLRRKLTPDYPMGCKRILFSSHFYPAVAKPDVDVVVDPIARIDSTAVVTADGRRREADCIIYGTGFDAGAFVAPMRVCGVGGRTLAETWRGGPRAHLGISVAGFPNLFLIYGPNTNLSVGSVIVMVEAQARYVAHAVSRIRPGRAIEVRAEVVQRWDADTQARLRDSVWTACANWYRDASGRVVNQWPGTMREYVDATRAFDPADYGVREPDAAR